MSTTKHSGRENVEDFYPLSPMQEGMLFHSLYAPESGVYVEQVSCKLGRNVDVAAFEETWKELMKRHTVLRTSFIGEGLKEQVQVVHRCLNVPLQYDDWSGSADGTLEERSNTLLANERNRGFEISKPPLMRLWLIRTGPEGYRFVWTYPHVMLDGWSVVILLNELFAIYELIINKKKIVLPEAKAYKDYIVWLKKQDLAAAEKFWRESLKGFTSPTTILPIKTSHHENESAEQYKELQREFSVQRTTTLQSFARRHQLTINTLVQGAWALLLSHYSGESDVVFGATVSGRPVDLPGVESMLGLFINTLPVRVAIPSHTSLIVWLKELQMRQVEQRSYEFSPLVQIHGWSDVPREHPLFQSLLVFENYPVSALMSKEEGSLILSDLQSAELTNYPLTVVAGVGETLLLKVIYDKSLYNDAATSRMLDQLQTLLDAFTMSPECNPVELPYLTDVEKHQLLVEWNDTRVDFPLGQCIHRQIEEAVRRNPEAPAVKSGEHYLTYRELNEKANMLAHYLRSCGVGPEIIVGICVTRSLEMIVGILAVLKAGGAYLPMDASYPLERLAFMCEDSGMKILLTQKSIAQNLSTKGIVTLDLDSMNEQIGLQSADNPVNISTPQNLAYVVYTSGSTGKPKGVMLHHEGLVNLVQWHIREYRVTATDRAAQLASAGFDACVWELFPYLVAGASIHVVNDDTRSDPTGLLEWFVANRITLSFVPTPMVKSMLDLAWPANTSLRAVLTGGDALHRRPNGLLPFSLINHYGPTESTVLATEAVVSPQTDGSASPSIGKPIANTRVHVLDTKLQPVPVGVPGELCIGGVGLARGYLNQPALTAERFIPDPFGGTSDSRLYRTGDLVRYLEDGNIEFLGRIDHQVKIRGYRIELDEIASVLTKYPGISDAVVLADAVRGQLVAFYAATTEIEPNDITASLNISLPEYMIPSTFVRLDSLPLTENGKVDRKALRIPEELSRRVGGEFVAARDTTELRLTRLWEEILQKHPIGVKDNFFALGGHSLLAVRLLGQIRKQFDREIQLISLFQNPTIEHLAGLLRETDPSAFRKTLVVLNKGGEKPPLFMIHPTGGSVHWYSDLAHRLPHDQPVYGIQAKGLDGKEELDTRIETMASRYVEAILEQQPHGPYYIGGWSLGVIIAFEVAQQLHSLGHEIGLLTVFDQGPFVPISEQPKDDAELLVNIFGDYISLDIDYLRKLGPDDLFRFVFKKAKKADLFPFYLRLQDFRSYVTVNNTQTQAWRGYEVKRYAGRITLVRSEETVKSLTGSPDMGWSQVSDGGVDVFDVPGDHISMLQEPHVRTLASVIDDCLACESNDEVFPKEQQNVAEAE